MPRAKLSEQVIQGLEYSPKGNSFQAFWDEHLPGFAVRIYESGAKSYIVKYRIQGKQFVDTLGPVELIPLERARESARRTLIRAYNERVGASKNDRLIAEVCNEYIERYARENVSDWASEEKLCTLYLKPTWGDRPISSLRKAEVVALLDTVGGINFDAANRLKILISRIWECATSWTYIDEAIKNPTLGIPDAVPHPEPCSPGDEAERLFSALETEPNYFVRAAILVLLFSGLHKDEVIKAQWDQIDWAANAMNVERRGNKKKRLFTMPLSEPALTILQAIPKHPSNPFVFPGKERGQPLADLNEPLDRLKRLAGLEMARIQNLRSFVTPAICASRQWRSGIMRVLGYSNQVC